MRELLRDRRLHVGALVCVCYVLGPVGYFAWFYNVAELTDAVSVDFYTLVLAYFVQALGVVAYMLARRTLGPRRVVPTVAAALALFVICTEPAARSGSATIALAAGLVASLPCGYFQGHYFTCLAEITSSREGGSGRGIALGAGYALATLLSYALSTVAGGTLVRGMMSLATCVVLALIASACLWVLTKSAPLLRPRADARGATRGLCKHYHQCRGQAQPATCREQPLHVCHRGPVLRPKRRRRDPLRAPGA